MKRFKKFLCVIFAAVSTLCFALGFSSCKAFNNGTRGLEYEMISLRKGARVLGIGKAKAKDIVISSKYKTRPVVEIKDHAFQNCSELTSVRIPDSVTSIGRAAFYQCGSLKSADISNNVTTIESSLFEDCGALQSVNIPGGVTSLGAYAFYRCSSLESITIPNKIKRIRTGAFLDCSALKSITIPDKLIEIGEKAFQNTAYYNNEENWREGLLYIGNHLIEAKKEEIVEATIKEGTKTIAEAAFKDCGLLESVTVLEGVVFIGEKAFEDCALLTSVTLPRSVRVLSDRTFYNCAALTTIYYQGSKENWYEVSKGEDWNYGMGEYTVICTDGQI